MQTYEYKDDLGTEEKTHFYLPAALAVIRENLIRVLTAALESETSAN